MHSAWHILGHVRLGRVRPGRVRVRPIAGVLLLLALLWAPFAPMAALAQGAPSCGMKCCARMKKCCCKGEKHASPESQRGPMLRQAPSCPRDCQQAPAFRPLMASPPTLHRQEIPIPATSRRSGHAAHRLWIGVWLSYASHPRPPPFPVL